jgi:hypothetical protein
MPHDTAYVHRLLDDLRGPVEITRLEDDDPLAQRMNRALDRLVLLKDALDLVSELWPKPGYASVTLETHQWIKLRRVLLAIPDLVAADE